MRVTVERSLWVSIGGIIAGQVPDDQTLVARAGEKHIRATNVSIDFRPSQSCATYFSREVARLVTQPE